MLLGFVSGIVWFFKSPWDYDFNPAPHSSQYLFNIFTLNTHIWSNISIMKLWKWLMWICNMRIWLKEMHISYLALKLYTPLPPPPKKKNMGKYTRLQGIGQLQLRPPNFFQNNWDFYTIGSVCLYAYEVTACSILLATSTSITEQYEFFFQEPFYEVNVKNSWHCWILHQGFLTHFQILASGSEIYWLKWYHYLLKLRSKPF